jgi:translation elongation factor EF-Tu-like GTPase
MYNKIQVLAQLKLFSGENMRRTPFVSTYRPIFEFKGARTKISGRIDLLNTKSFYPGTTGIVQITFLKDMIDDNYFKKGETFKISEGGEYILGEGEIIEVLAT